MTGQAGRLAFLAASQIMELSAGASVLPWACPLPSLAVRAT